MKNILNSGNYIDLKLIDNIQRDLVLVLPGGGYSITSNREADPVANIFNNADFHTAVYYYRENLLLYPELKQEGYEVIKYLSGNDSIRNIYLIGFSAGGHLAGILMTKFYKDIKGTILAYPVITSNIQFSHQGSINNLLGSLKTDELLFEVSIEKHVHSNVNPVFIMHTMDDQSVPVENSILLLEALKKNHVPVEAHFYPNGRHGLSIATKEVSFEDMDPNLFVKEYGYISKWTDLAVEFLERLKK